MKRLLVESSAKSVDAATSESATPTRPSAFLEQHNVGLFNGTSSGNTVFFPMPREVPMKCSRPSTSNILSPTSVTPSPKSWEKNPIEEAVFTFDRLAQDLDSNTASLTNPNNEIYFPTHSIIQAAQDKYRSFMNFDEDEGQRWAQSSRPASERLHRRGLGKYFHKYGGSLDQTDYRNDEELAKVFSGENSKSNSQTRLNEVILEGKVHQLGVSQESLKEIDWDDFQGAVVDEVMEENGGKFAKFQTTQKEVRESTTSEEVDPENLQIVSPEPDDVHTEELFMDTDDDDHSSVLVERVKEMEVEHDLLTNSLLALTSHFAQIQLRLGQIVKEASSEKQDVLLHELESFANRGIPELAMRMASSRCTSRGLLERSVSGSTSLTADELEELNVDLDCESLLGSRVWRHSSSTDDHIDSHRSRRESCSTSSYVTSAQLAQHRCNLNELIKIRKEQIEDMERYAYEMGDQASLPHSMRLERQNVILEQLNLKIPSLSIGEIDKLSPEELRKKVDSAVQELVHPKIMNEQLVKQLKTQITDLERYIRHLQKDGNSNEKHHHLVAAAAASAELNSKLSKLIKFFKIKRNAPSSTDSKGKAKLKSFPEKHSKESKNSKKLTNALNGPEKTEGALSIMSRFDSLLGVFAWTQLGECASFAHPDDATAQRPKPCAPLTKNTLKSVTRHWGNLRAQLEMSICDIVKLYREKQNMNTRKKEQLATLVRKDFSVSLQSLLQHGLIGASESGMEVVQNGFHVPKLRASISRSTTLASFNSGQNQSFLSLALGCFTASGSALSSITHAPVTRPMHAWEVILHFYDLKNGSKFCATASRRLSASFGLGVVSDTIKPKHSLFAAIDDIIDTHTPHNRSLDAHFKAFVVMGLNQQMLSQWLRLIVRNTDLVNACYESWSYTASTRFEDALRQLDQLESLRFTLPTDLAVKQLQSIQYAFSECDKM